MAKTLPAVICIIFGVLLLAVGLIWLAIKGSKTPSRTGPYALIGVGLLLIIIGAAIYFILKNKKTVDRTVIESKEA